jgi:hypothetical protein
MKRLGLAICFMFLMVGIVFAEVTAEVIGYDLDDNGNIRVKTQYKIDGVEVQSNYPKQDGKAYYVTRFNAMNFLDMTEIEIKDRIMTDAKAYCNAKIMDSFNKEANKNIVNTKLKDLVGSKVTVIEIEVKVNSKDYIIKQDGTINEKVVVVPITE